MEPINELKFVHIRPYSFAEGQIYEQHGGMTLAYTMPHRRGDKMIYVSVANCSKYDMYCKKTGRALAAEKFVRGESIQLATDPTQGIGTQLSRAFRPLMGLGVPLNNEEKLYVQRMHKSRQATQERAKRLLQASEPARNEPQKEDSPF